MEGFVIRLKMMARVRATAASAAAATDFAAAAADRMRGATSAAGGLVRRIKLMFRYLRLLLLPIDRRESE